MIPILLIATIYTQEEIQQENEVSWEKEIQSWIDAKDFAREFLDQNLGSAVEAGCESVIHHWEALYHSGKVLQMELGNYLSSESVSEYPPESYEEDSRGEPEGFYEQSREF